MRIVLVTLSFAVGLGFLGCRVAAAFPGTPGVIAQEATAVSPLQHTQYAERRTRRGIVKCYRDFIFGPYRCHYY